MRPFTTALNVYFTPFEVPVRDMARKNIGGLDFGVNSSWILGIFCMHFEAFIAGTDSFGGLKPEIRNKEELESEQSQINKLGLAKTRQQPNML